MKSLSAIRRRGAVAVRRRATVAVTTAAFALVFAASMAGTSLAQDTSKSGSSWERLDSVLVVPPVYRPDADSGPDSGRTDGCAEDCPAADNPGIGGLPTAVVGTADNPTAASAGTADNPTDQSVAVDGQSAAVDGSTPDGSASQQQAAATGDQQSADGLDPSVGSAQEYQEQQAAQELGSNGIVQVPAVIIGVPVGSYYAPGTFAPAAPAFAPARSLSSPAWMPQPMPRVAPLPSLVPHGVARNIGGFPGGIPGGFSGGFNTGFPQMSGFRGAFGHR